MSLPYFCPSCGHTGAADDQLAGRKTECPKCLTEITVQPPPDPEVDPAEEVAWRRAMLIEASQIRAAAIQTSVHVRATRTYVGWLLAITVAGILLPIFLWLVWS